MKIWIINPYGNMPGESWRVHRSFMVAQAFAQKKHEVVYWISNFEHRSKKFRSNGFETVKINAYITINIVPTTAYQIHTSFKRIFSEINFIVNLRKLAPTVQRPDLIVIGEPATFVSFNFMRIVKSLKTKFIVDFVDLWPELFAITLKGFLKKAEKIIFFPFYQKRKWFLRKADGLIAVSQSYLNVANTIANPKYQKVIYWGVDLASISDFSKGASLAHLLLPKKQQGDIWVIYAGTLGDNYDIKTIMQCASFIEADASPIKLIIAGDGALSDYVKTSIEENGLTKTFFLGRVDINILNQLYQLCDIGLSSYVVGSTVSMPIKAFDYLAAGLPMVNSLGMDLEDFVVNKKVGLQYQAGNSASMYNKISALASDKELLQQMKRNALELAQQFDQQKLYEEYVDFSIKVIESKS
jgi:glycosyltransferase involved in cell wall biosynthesis